MNTRDPLASGLQQLAARSEERQERRDKGETKEEAMTGRGGEGREERGDRRDGGERSGSRRQTPGGDIKEVVY